jgi:hypothetical protein
MRHARRLVWAAPILGAALLATAACGSSSSSSSTGTTSGSSTMSTSGTSTGATADAQLCAASNQMKTAIQGMKNLSSDPSLSGFATATGNVVTAWSSLQSAAANAKSSIDTTQLKNAVNTFESTMTSLPSKGLSLSQDVAQAKTAIVPVEDAVKNLVPNCSGTSTTGS